MQVKYNNIFKLCSVNFRINALLCSYGMTYSPWRPLRAFQHQAKIKLPTADCFSTRQLYLCHRPGSYTSATQKWDHRTACNWCNRQIRAWASPRDNIIHYLPPLTDVNNIHFMSHVMYIHFIVMFIVFSLIGQAWVNPFLVCWLRILWCIICVYVILQIC